MPGHSFAGWPADTVKDFVEHQLNFFDTEWPTDLDRSLETTDWKIWLWLEQAGFDFATISLRPNLGREFHDRARDITYEQERLLLYQIRVVMRSVLGLVPLHADALADLLAKRPLDMIRHWTVSGPDGAETDESNTYDWAAKAFSDLLDLQYPGYASIISKLVNEEGRSHDYIDTFSGNGAYSMTINQGFCESVIVKITLPIFAGFYDGSVVKRDYYLFHRLFKAMLEYLLARQR